jgi:hypothetical protein
MIALAGGGVRIPAPGLTLAWSYGGFQPGAEHLWQPTQLELDFGVDVYGEF